MNVHHDNDTCCGARNVILILLMLVVITFTVYMRAAQCRYDDEACITQNQHVANGITGKNVIRAFTSVHEANWHPVTWLAHMADVQIYHMNPPGHYLTNVIIQILPSALLLYLLLRCIGSLWQSSFIAASVLAPSHACGVGSMDSRT